MPVTRIKLSRGFAQMVVHRRDRQEHPVRNFFACHPFDNPDQAFAFARCQRAVFGGSGRFALKQAVSDLMRRHMQRWPRLLQNALDIAGTASGERHQTKITVARPNGNGHTIDDAEFLGLPEHLALTFLKP